MFLPPRRAFRVSRGVQAALGVQGKSGYRSIRDARMKRAIEHPRSPTLSPSKAARSRLMPLIESRLRGHNHLVAVQLAIRLHHAGPSLDRLSRAGFARMFVARKRLKREPMSRILHRNCWPCGADRPERNGFPKLTSFSV